VSLFLGTFRLPLFTSYYKEIPKDKDSLFFRRLPVEVLDNSSLGYLYQVTNPENHKFIEEAFKLGSTFYNTQGDESFPQGAHNIARHRDFVDNMARVLGIETFAGLRILEVGCGPGHLLKLLKDEGADVMGCDPGPYGHFAKEHLGIEILQKTFDADLIESGLLRTGHFDLVINFALLDLLSDPVSFLKLSKDLLKINGNIVCGVRDFEPYLKLGNPLGINPEHQYYFTSKSLSYIFELAGLSNIKILSSQYGLGLVATGSRPVADILTTSEDKAFPKSNEQLRSTKEMKSPRIEGLHDGYFSRTNQFVNRLQNRLMNLMNKNLAIMGGNLDTANLFALLNFDNVNTRIFEQDHQYVGKFIPGVSEPIFHDDLIDEFQPDEVWIMPLGFCDKIETNLRKKYSIQVPMVKMNSAPSSEVLIES